jgi:hypothetical protein
MYTKLHRHLLYSQASQHIYKLEAGDLNMVSRCDEETGKLVMNKYLGWEIGVVIAITTATFAFGFNFIFLIVVTIRQTLRPSGLGTLVEGDCAKIDWINKISHGVVNIMRTVSVKLFFWDTALTTGLSDSYFSIKPLYATAYFPNSS